MGDIADQLIDDMFDPMYEDYDDADGWPMRDPIKCKYCKRIGFHWMFINDKWRLTTRTGKAHHCKAYLDTIWRR